EDRSRSADECRPLEAHAARERGDYGRALFVLRRTRCEDIRMAGKESADRDFRQERDAASADILAERIEHRLGAIGIAETDHADHVAVRENGTHVRDRLGIAAVVVEDLD